MHLMRPDRISIVLSSEPGQMVSHYIYDVNGNKEVIQKEEMIHIKTTNPYNPWRGMSLLQSIIKHIDIDNEARDFTKSLLENKAAPGGFLKIMGNMTKEQMRRALESFKQRFSGDNRGTLGVIDGDVEFINTSMNLQELNFSHITQLTESRILSALGVNPVLIGVTAGQQGSTFNNVAEAKLSFYQQTIIPLQSLVADAFSNDQDLNAANDIEFFFDTSKVGALEPLRIKSTESSREGWKEGYVTLNEARTAAGLPPIEGEEGDQFKAPVKNIAPQTDDTDELEEELAEQPEKKQSAEKRLQLETEWAEDVRKTAHKGYRATVAWATLVFGDMYADLENAMKFSRKDTQHDQMVKFEAEIEKMQHKWASRIAADENIPLAQITRDILQKQEAGGVNLSFRFTNEEITQAVKQYSFKFAERLAKTGSDKARKLFLEAREARLGLGELKQALLEEFKGQVSKQWATTVARTETIRAANEGTLSAYKMRDVQTIRWVAAGDSCAYCAGLDGQTVTTGDSFIKGLYQPEGASSPLNTSYTGGNIPVPPIHPHCRCTIMRHNV